MQKSKSKATPKPRTRIAHAFTNALFAYKEGALRKHIAELQETAESNDEYETELRIFKADEDDDCGEIYYIRDGPFQHRQMAEDIARGNNEAIMANQALRMLNKGDDEYLLFFTRTVRPLVHVHYDYDRGTGSLTLKWLPSVFDGGEMQQQQQP